MYKLIVCSVDDTLLTNNHTLSEDTKEALLQAQQAGARLALISRRSPHNLKKIAEKLQMNTYKGYIAACHGAFLQEMGSERVLRKKEVSLKLVDRIKALAEGQDVTLSIVENGCLYASGIDPYVQLEALLNDMRLCPWEAFEDISDTVLKLYVTGESSALNGFISWMPKTLEEEIKLIRSGRNMCSIVHADVDKGTALQCIMQDMDIQKEDVLLIADSTNDKAMAPYAGCVSVMANAEDEVRKDAAFLTHSNECDGIVRTLEVLTQDVEVI